MTSWFVTSTRNTTASSVSASTEKRWITVQTTKTKVVDNCGIVLSTQTLGHRSAADSMATTLCTGYQGQPPTPGRRDDDKGGRGRSLRWRDSSVVGSLYCRRAWVIASGCLSKSIIAPPPPPRLRLWMRRHICSFNRS